MRLVEQRTTSSSSKPLGAMAELAVHAGLPGLLPAMPASDPTNVIRLSHVRHGETAAQLTPEILAVPVSVLAREPERAIRLWVLLAVSAAAHLALYLPFQREPDPM